MSALGFLLAVGLFTLWAAVKKKLNETEGWK